MSAPPPKPEPPPTASRSAQLALGVLLLLLVASLGFRGYGNFLGTKPVDSAAPALTDLNQAGRAELEQIPGIGPSLAKKIDDHRREKGPFRSLEELRRVKGIGPATFDKVSPYLTVPASVQPSGEVSIEPLVLERRPPVPAPYPRSSGAGGKLQPGDPPVDVNAAAAEELMRIPGVGPVTAQNILKARAERPFTSVADLDRVKGIGPKTLEKLRPFVVVK